MSIGPAKPECLL